MRNVVSYYSLIDSYLSESNIQHSMLSFHKEDSSLPNIKGQGILATTLLASLVIHNFFITDVYMEYIADVKYQLYRIQLANVFIQKNQ